MISGTPENLRSLAEEVPVSLTFNGVAAAVMMMSPHDLEDFVTGFAVTEGLVNDAGNVGDIEVRTLPRGYLVSADVPPEVITRLDGYGGACLVRPAAAFAVS